MLDKLFNNINKAKNVASIGEKRKWGNRWYMKTPRGWALTNEEVNKITDEAFRAREGELERRINEDPEFRARYQKDYGEGYTPFVHLKGNISVKEVAGIRLRNSGVDTKAKNLMSLFSSSERQWVIPMLEKNIPLTDKMREVIKERGRCELYFRKTKNSAPVRVIVEMDASGRFRFMEATKREGKVDEWKPSVGSVLDLGLSEPHFYSIDLAMPFKDEIEKAKGAVIGEEREWGGKIYVKTVKGWRPKGKGVKSSKDDEDKTEQPSKTEAQGEDKKAILEGYASQATDKQLETAINKPGQSEEVKGIAKQELENRGKEVKEGEDGISSALNKLLQSDEFDDGFKGLLQSKLDERTAKKQEKEKESSEKKEFESFKKEVTERLDKLEQENSGHKQIKKTGIVVDGKKIFITMDGDRYQAKRGGETLKSEPNESLSSFKDKVRKKWEGSLTNNHDTKETEPSNKDRLPRSPEVESAVDRVKKIIKDSDFEKGEAYNVVFKNPEKALKADPSKNAQLQINAALLDQRLKPIMEPFMFTEYGGEKYKSYDQYFMTPGEAGRIYRENLRPAASSLSNDEFEAMKRYGKGMDSVIRELNTYGEVRSSYVEDYNLNEDDVDDSIKWNKALEEYLDKNRLSENLILSRRMDFSTKENPFAKLKPGDTFTDPSFSSYSLQQMKNFGDFQVTLLAKKGQPVSPIRTEWISEMEYLVQKGSKFKVIEIGFNSIAVEIVD